MDNVPPIPNWSGLVSMRNGPDFAPITEHLFPKTTVLLYDVLNDYLNSAYDLSPYTLYDEPLAPLTGTQSQLPVILSEYRFYEISDIENYLQLLTKTPEYFRSILNFEHTKSESGLLWHPIPPTPSSKNAGFRSFKRELSLFFFCRTAG